MIWFLYYCRSAMDFDYTHCMLMEAKKGKENPVASSPAKEAYRKQLAEVLNLNRCKIIAFKNKPPTPAESLFPNSSVQQVKPAANPRRSIPQRTLDAPEIIDDYYLNLLDWGSSNVLAIALNNIVYLWDATDSSTSELMVVDEETGHITSVSWAPDGRHVVVGLNNSEVQLWDSTSNKQLRTLRGGKQLASGGNDNLLHIWDKSVASSNSPTQWLHRLEDHTAAVKALAW
ncbi:hypothetical protein MKW94_016496 [Papaver nudicaule]|uniref:Anaphase-promoting complex subunit 4-like WD40 domain-containing protein n=1 Tax=Papaver nudicaule TaxID=74823 RepID=A0AA41SHV2_PAPNU|nr:hypothetical protein [Papaver nudicaule]